jgi:DNA-binding CsgD family transcriptional regulator
MSRADDNLAAMRRDGESGWEQRLQARMDAVPKQLSERETMILRCASYGLHRDDAAALLGISSETAKSYSERARRKLQAKNTTHAVALAIRGGLL